MRIETLKRNLDFDTIKKFQNKIFVKSFSTVTLPKRSNEDYPCNLRSNFSNLGPLLITRGQLLINNQRLKTRHQFSCLDQNLVKPVKPLKRLRDGGIDILPSLLQLECRWRSLSILHSKFLRWCHGCLSFTSVFTIDNNIYYYFL